MNANEVIANRAASCSAASWARSDPVHPNDHVNMGQSSQRRHSRPRCTSPPRGAVDGRCSRRSQQLAAALARQGRGVGRRRQDRPHPPAWTRRRSGWARSSAATPAGRAGRRSRAAAGAQGLAELAARRHRRRHRAQHPPGVRRPRSCELVSAAPPASPFREAPNHFEAQAASDAVVEASRRAQDDRRLADQDRQRHPPAGLAARAAASASSSCRPSQPGSSIMPGKVNPVICEAVIQVCRAGDRQRRRGRPGAARRAASSSTSMMPADRPQPAAVDPDASAPRRACWQSAASRG